MPVDGSGRTKPEPQASEPEFQEAPQVQEPDAPKDESPSLPLDDGSNDSEGEG